MIGRRLIQLRNKHQLTQQEIADQLGIPRSTYAQYESDRREIGIDVLKKIAQYYGVSIDWLVEFTSSNTKQPSVEETEFLKWIEENVGDVFFYDFDRSPEERKKQLMQDLRYLWERDKNRYNNS
ncbi:helix-turn-helix domain-containing protein [Sulfoacidibacillus thermotolerans]|uniref:HTH cro/C1-type domain-containing protein n=1 Tax=Sulfoacidibacillus thermotolerans TaxID=1765684 RepID=A0A2U3D5X4_SULT2|nr:helix-turn-helix transcriptional regulator [Sulfoacidibacillus thermotolerans]PWI56670.1 hypothetical protein BM613_12640 [Sulfoacidibacillus thermotolerans]